MYYSPGAAYLEMIRCGLFIVGDVALCQVGVFGDKGYRPAAMQGLDILYAFSIAIWIAELARRTVVVQKKDI